MLLVFVVAGRVVDVLVMLENVFWRDGRRGGAGGGVSLVVFRSSEVDVLVAAAPRRVGGTGGGAPRFDAGFDVSDEVSCLRDRLLNESNVPLVDGKLLYTSIAIFLTASV